jgi:hypothetical protein
MTSPTFPGARRPHRRAARQATITIDGIPLPRGQVTGYVLQHDIPDALPMLILHTRQPAGVMFEGLARVAVAAPAGPSGRSPQFLAGIDPAASPAGRPGPADLDGGKHGVTEAILKQLADWAQPRRT